MYVHTKSCVYKVRTGTEKHCTDCLIFLISNKKVIEDTVRAIWHLIFTRIDNKLKEGCSNISKALSRNSYILIAIFNRNWSVHVISLFKNKFLHALQWLSTVEPLLWGHPLCIRKVAFQEGWPLVRGRNQCIYI